MQFGIAVLLLLLSAGFVGIGIFFRDRRNAGYLVLTGFVILMLTGLLLSYDEITVKSGEVIEAVNNTSSVTTFTYEEPNAVTNSVLSMILILGGLWGIIATSRLMKMDSEEDEE